MKKTLLFLLVCICLDPVLNAQSSDDSKRAVKEGDNTINVYYGTNVRSRFYKRVASATAENLEVKSFGPIGLVYEHMVSEIVGLGAEFGYSRTKLDYYDSYFVSGSTQNYIYTLDFTTIRAMLRANFHFADAEKFDAYALISIGYRRTTFRYSTTDPYDIGLSYNSLIPVGMKPGIGLRYFFTKNIGLNMELAIGTPIACGGLSFKF